MKLLQSPLKDFDEEQYLRLNPDVKQAVDAKQFSSGWHHFLLYGFLEERQGVTPDVQKVVNSLLNSEQSEALPPENLRKRVHGEGNLASFESVGRMISLDIHNAINGHLSIENNTKVYDFGCGCARVIKYLKSILGNGIYYGSDIDEEAINWCSGNLSSIADFKVNVMNPPLPYDNCSFDFIYSISVFTHLPEDMQFLWLDELNRVSRKNALILLTTHGESLLKNVPDEITKQFLDHGFFYAVGEGTEGLPDFYQTSFHTHDYIKKSWSQYFEIVDIIPRGIANHQDLILCRKAA